MLANSPQDTPVVRPRFFLKRLSARGLLHAGALVLAAGLTLSQATSAADAQWGAGRGGYGQNGYGNGSFSRGGYSRDGYSRRSSTNVAPQRDNVPPRGRFSAGDSVRPGMIYPPRGTGRPGHGRPGYGRPGYGMPMFPGRVVVGPMPGPRVIYEDDFDDAPPPRVNDDLPPRPPKAKRPRPPVDTADEDAPRRPKGKKPRKPAVASVPPAGQGGSGGPPRQSAGAPQSPRAAWNGVNGLPPSGERRFVPDHIVCVLRDGISDQEITRFLRSHRMTRTEGGRQQIGLINSQLFRYRITDRRDVSRVIADLQRDPRVLFAQPDYLYDLTDDNSGNKESVGSIQYTVGKMHLRRAHELVRGEKIKVAVIDSAIDTTHPELKGAIVKEIDVVGDKDRTPHAHGTAMAGAIVAKSQLTGVAPAAEIIAIRAFAPKSSAQGSGTSFQLTRAIDSAVDAGARIINLSFAGPADPMLQRAMQAARARGAILIAAIGNAGPKSGPLYPAADPNVIAVTATDANDHIYGEATRGKYVAVAAPGVDVLVAAPRSEYGLSTGTSVAAAHVSGVAALLLARQSTLDADAVRRTLVSTARSGTEADAGALGAGIVDAFQAVMSVGGGSAAQGVPAGRGAAPAPALSMQ